MWGVTPGTCHSKPLTNRRLFSFQCHLDELPNKFYKVCFFKKKCILLHLKRPFPIKIFLLQATNYRFKSQVSWFFLVVLEACHPPFGRVHGCEHPKATAHIVTQKHPHGNLPFPPEARACHGALWFFGVCWPEKHIR